MVVALTPFVLFALLALLLYCPPVQKWAVDKAADWLGEEMGMDVSIENVRLKYPLDLSLGGMLAVQDGDTVLNAEELRLSVQFLPLLDKQVNIDDITLRNADVNTRGLIDAVLIKGHVGELEAYTHGVDLKDSKVLINQLALKNSDILLALPDTVPPDSVEKEPAKWKLDFQDINLKKVKFALSLPPEKGHSIEDLYGKKKHTKDLDTYFDKATLRAYVDLENSVYTVNDLKATNSKARFQQSFDADGIALLCDSIRYADPRNLFVNINKMQGKEASGMNFKDVSGQVLMDSTRLVLPDFSVLTDDSEINLTLDMPFNTWDSIAPGEMQLGLRSVMGKSDVMAITRYVDRFLDEGSKLDDVRKMVQEYMPVKPTPLNANVVGNLQDFRFNNVYAQVPGIGKLDGSVRMQGDNITAKTEAKLAGGNALIDGSYNIGTEAFDITADVQEFNVNKYVDLPEKTRITGRVKAKGKGFDIYSPKTQILASANVAKGNYGKVNLSNMNADIQLAKQVMDLNLNCSNNQLVTDFSLSGNLKKGIADGVLNIDLPYIDLHAMGYSDDKLIVKTNGKVDFYSNLDDVFTVKSFVNGLDIETPQQNLHTEDFDLFAETTKKATTARFDSGDLSFSFDAPENLFRILAKSDKLTAVFKKQAKNRDLNFDILRKYIPNACLKAKAGRNNPLATYLLSQGFKYRDLMVDLDASPEVGVVGTGYVNALQKDSIMIERAYFDIHQDSTRIVFNSGLNCKDQPMFPAFSATIDGYLGSRDADLRLKYYDKEKVMGTDLGAHVVGLDSVWRLTLYPEKPIIANRRFELADTSYVDFYREKGHPIIGDVRLKSLTDDCNISLVGIDNEGEQRALVEVNDLNLEGLAKVLPFLPQLEGLFSIDAAYQEQEGKFWVDGIMDIKDFVYEGTAVGNVGSLFTYEPDDKDVHHIEGDISFEGTDVVTLDGSYDASGEGLLDADIDLLDIPMEMLSSFIPDQMVVLDGNLAGSLCMRGSTDKLKINGYVLPKDIHAFSPYYSVKLRLSNDSVNVVDSKVAFDKYAIYGYGDNPIEMTGDVDFGNFDNIPISLTLVGRNVQLIDSKRTRKAVLFGNAFGDIYARITGSSNEISVRGALNVLNSTNVTYLMTETALSQGDRLDDIVTFVDFTLPPDSAKEVEGNKIMGVDMNMRLNVEDGARVRCEFSADRQSYVDIRGGGSLTMNYSPRGVMNVQGRLTANEGEMKYTLPVIPLKSFTIQPGSYVNFDGDLYNPLLNIAAKSRTKAAVQTEGSSTRSVAFDVGIKITNTLNDMGLAFTLDAPEDGNMQEELSNYSDEEKGKLAVALLATGMYVADNNMSALNANTALTTFLQSELNNITGRALNSIVDVSLGMDKTTLGTDYSFKFSKRFFSDRLSVVIGGRVSDKKEVNQATGIGSFIDDVSLEWRIDPGATRLVRLFHNKDYNNIFEGVLENNGAGVIFRKRIDSLSELMFWKKKKEEEGRR